MEFGNTLMLLPHRLLLCYLVLLSSQRNILCSEVVGPSKVKSSLLDTTTWVLIPKEAEVIHSLANLTDGVYSLKPATVRPTCLTAEGSGLDFLGFNNRTCSTPQSAQNAAGPVMRSESDSQLWYDWMVRTRDSDTSNQSVIVTLQAFIDPGVKGGAKCLGYLSTLFDSSDYESTCSLAPYGNTLFLNENEEYYNTSSRSWSVHETGEEGAFQLIAVNKPEDCARVLAVEGCNAQPVLVDYSQIESTGSIQSSWVFVKKYNLVQKDTQSSSPPPSPPPPPPPPPPPMAYPGPEISSPRSTSSGYVNVLVSKLGGNEFCSIDSILIKITPSSHGAVPEILQVSASTPGLDNVGVPLLLKSFGYNSIYAYGSCSTGETTEMSNTLVIFSLFGSGGVPPPPDVMSSPSPALTNSSPSLPPPSWTTVGIAGFSTGTADYTSLAIDSSDIPYVAYKDGGNGNKATVMKFVSGSWQTVGIAGFSTGTADYTSIAIDSFDIPYVAYKDGGNGKKATVMKFVSGSWQTVGIAGFSEGEVSFVRLAIDSASIPYVAYKDYYNNIKKATVMKFVAGSWTTVGNPRFSTGVSDYVSLAINSLNIPYVACRDYSTQKATVFKFDTAINANNWVLEGTDGISAGPAGYESIAFDSSNIPYVSYKDGGNSNELTVRKFLGGSWTYVGEPGFSGVKLFYTSIALDSANIPYVAFKNDSSTLATVMKFVSGSWVPAGEPGFSAGAADQISLAIDSLNTLYLAYTDGGNGNKATVMKL